MSGLEKSLFTLKLTSKNLTRQAKKANDDSIKEQAKVKKALTQTPPQPEIARLYANNSVRNSQQRLQLLTLAARIDAVAARVQTAITMRTVTASMAQTVRGMEGALKNMNVEKMGAIMEKFEGQFEDLDVVSGFYEGVAGGVQNEQIGAVGQTEVDALMGRVADEAGVELDTKMQKTEAPTEEPVAEGSTSKGKAQVDIELAERLKKLLNANEAMV